MFFGLVINDMSVDLSARLRLCSFVLLVTTCWLGFVCVIWPCYVVTNKTK